MNASLTSSDSPFHIRQHSVSLDEHGVSPLFYPQKLCLQLDDIELWKEPLKMAGAAESSLNGGGVGGQSRSMTAGGRTSVGLESLELNDKPMLASLADTSDPHSLVSLSRATTVTDAAYLVTPVGGYKISRVAFCFRDQRQIRLASRFDRKTIFNLSYHSIMFDVIKVNLLKKGFESHGKYAQAIIKLSELESYKDGAHIIKVPLVDCRKKDLRLGTISVLLQFYDFLVQDYALSFRGLLMTCDPDEMSSPSSSQSSFSIPKNYDGGSNRNRAFTLNESPSLSAASNGTTCTGGDSSKINDFVLSDDFDDNQTEYFSATSSYFSASRDGDSHASAAISWKEKTDPSHASHESLKSHSSSTISYEEPASARVGLAGLKSLAAGLKATGWKISTTDLPRAFALMGRYYRTYSTPKTGKRVLDIEKLQEADYYLKFIMPVYGSVARKFFGYGSAADLVKRNRSVAIKHLGINENYMLAWEYSSSSKTIFGAKPCFYICFDEVKKAIHVCIRGTWSLQDVFTDINCEFVPFLGGTAHKGILQSALWIRDNYWNKIKAWIREYNASALHLSGHSLGGSISSILLMLVREEVISEMAPGFECRSFSFAPAPCVSPDLIEDFQPFIDSYVNKHDPVPTLSYGAAMDLKEMLVHAAAISKDPTVKGEKQLEKLYDFATELRKSNKHPRLLIPGQIYFMYKTAFTSPSSSSNVGYVVEESIPEYFDHLHLKFDMMYHHFPSIYHNSLQKAINQLEKDYKSSQFLEMYK